MFSSNKLYSINEFEAYLRIKNEKKYINNKPVFYKVSNIVFYTLIFLQNFSVIYILEIYLENSYIIYYKISISIFLFCSIIFFIF